MSDATKAVVRLMDRFEWAMWVSGFSAGLAVALVAWLVFRF